MFNLNWSPSQKAAARKAFDQALNTELSDIIQETKRRAAVIHEPSQLWELEDWLAARRKDIDRKYDYRYSVLPSVFAILVAEGRLAVDDLQGIGEEKVDIIRQFTSQT